jgi:hypothetical protein
MTMLDVMAEPRTALRPGLDRCDRCGAQALVRVVITASNLPLLFCSHHYAHYARGLAYIAVRTHDERPELDEAC